MTQEGDCCCNYCTFKFSHVHKFMVMGAITNIAKLSHVKTLYVYGMQSVVTVTLTSSIFVSFSAMRSCTTEVPACERTGTDGFLHQLLQKVLHECKMCE